jgi:magnesium transporter
LRSEAMAKKIKHIQHPQRSKKSGLGPDSLVYVGNKNNTAVQIELIDYNADFQRSQKIDHVDQCAAFCDSKSVTWIDVAGIHDSAVIEAIGNQFHIHPLVLEDIMNSTSRPKVEFFDDYMFITMKMLETDASTGEVQKEQLSLIVSKGHVIMFQEQAGDDFDPIRERIKTAKGKVRNKDGYYLAYLILDIVVDKYIATNETLLSQIEEVEDTILKEATEQTLHRILALRKDLIDIKHGIDPMKEAINTISLEMDAEINKYYRDLYDHIIYESENLSMYREMIVNLMDLYHSTLSVKMNQVMKVLTIMTTIFVPLTFIVGVYGMNFDNMPELHEPNGYFFVMGSMALVVIGMLFYFRKKRWL